MMTATKAGIVLLVEDDANLRAMFRTALTLDGFQVYEAGNGYDALRLLDQNIADAVILDLHLPHIDGLTVLAEIQAHTPGLPVVIVTGSNRHLTDVHVNCILRKPVAPDTLIDTLRKCLELS